MIDILAFAAHPDDAELSCAGTLIAQKKKGYKTGIIDLTRGELGTRGTAETRDQEAQISAAILDLDVRENLDLGDGFFEESKEHLIAIIGVIRKYKPKILLANAIRDRHPDHARAAKLVERAAFLSGLVKIKDEYNQKPHRPKIILHYIQDRWIEPDIVVDITKHYTQKIEAIKAFKTQFFDPKSSEPETPISASNFFAYLEGRAREFGRYAQTDFAEGFTKSKALPIDDLSHFL